MKEDVMYFWIEAQKTVRYMADKSKEVKLHNFELEDIYVTNHLVNPFVYSKDYLVYELPTLEKKCLDFIPFKELLKVRNDVIQEHLRNKDYLPVIQLASKPYQKYIYYNMFCDSTLDKDNLIE